MAAAPLHDQDRARVGIVITGRILAAPFMEAELHPLVHLVQAHSANVDMPPIFAALRQRAAFEERECLAHEIHNVIAQELVALGYRIDVARFLASTPSSPLALALDAVWVDLSRALTDLRLRIADLRLAVRPTKVLAQW